MSTPGTSNAAERIEELLTADDPGLDRLLAVVASVDRDPPTERQVVATLDDLAAEIDGTADSASQVITEVFGTLRFRGDERHYYDADNSLIHRVLDRRIGIPLSLAVVASELARRVGVDVRPVGMPGHVLLGSDRDDLWFDPFSGGTPLTRAACEEIHRSLRPEAPFHDSYLDRMTPRSVVVRTLENLRVAHLRSGERSRLPGVLGVRADLQGAPPEFRLELANVLASLGRADAAAEQRDLLAHLVPSRAEHHRLEAARLRARRN